VEETGVPEENHYLGCMILLYYYEERGRSGRDRTVVRFTTACAVSTNKTDRYDIAKILLKVALNTITVTQYV
jgi:hypothetical protein